MTRTAHAQQMAVVSTVTLALVLLVAVQIVLLGVSIEIHKSHTGFASLVLVATSGLCFFGSAVLARALR
jgi:hypothetical protein